MALITWTGVVEAYDYVVLVAYIGFVCLWTGDVAYGIVTVPN